MKSEKQIREVIKIFKKVSELTKTCPKVSKFYDEQATMLEWVVNDKKGE